MSGFWNREAKSPYTPKRTHSTYSHQFTLSREQKYQKLNTSPRPPLASSLPKRTVSLSKPEPRKVASPRYQQANPAEFMREEIEIVPDFSVSMKPRDLAKCRVERVRGLLKQTEGVKLPDYEPSRFSKEATSLTQAYAANTNQGVVRNYNEDRVAIILNIKRPEGVSEHQWKKCHFFGVYDGHGGAYAADYLRDNLHQLIVKDPAFIEKPPEAIKQGFARAEQLIIDLAQRQPNGVLEKSGSCAVVLFVVGKMCYIANVGDSRAIMSCEEGEMLYELSIDHKPTDPHEQLRVVSGGGKIYQTKISNPNFNPGEPRFVLGPYRVLPGRLSVTRTFGDAEAKLVKYGGNPNVVIARPEIKYFEVGPEVDFILLCSDGVFDKATSQEIIQLVWEVARTQRANYSNVHNFCGLATERILKFAIARKSSDNITAVMVAFEGLGAKLEKIRGRDLKEKQQFAPRDKASRSPAQKAPDLRRVPSQERSQSLRGWKLVRSQ